MDCLKTPAEKFNYGAYINASFLCSLTLGAHAHEGYGSLFVCLFVCLFICYQSTACLRHLYNKMNILANFSPNSKGFQLRDFAKKLSVTSYI